MSGMQYKGKITDEKSPQNGMYAYEGKAWGGGGREHQAVYDLDGARQVPAFEKAATEFEAKIGAWAFGYGQPYAETVCNKVVDYMTLKWADAGTLSKTLDEKLAAISGMLPKLGTGREGIAGAVGESKEAIGGVLKEGNLRERMVVVENFAKNVMAEDYMDQAGLEKLIEKADALKMDLELELMETSGAPDKWSAPWEAGAHNRGQTEVANGDLFRGKGSQDLSKDVSDPSLKGEAEANAGKKTTSSTDLTMPPASELGGKNPVGKFEGAFQQSKGVDEGEKLKWANPVADMVMNEANAWVQTQRKDGMPLKGGPSGHTHKFMMTNQILGMPISPDDMRIVCLGHLLPINAHTFVEVIEAAKPFGASPVPQSPMMYRHLAPMGEGLKAAVGADKWPDEVLSAEDQEAAKKVEAPEQNTTLVPESLKGEVTGGSSSSTAPATESGAA
jgi:hypothetical protein